MSNRQERLARAEHLNADHHGRMAADAIRVDRGTAEARGAISRASRAKLVWAMLGCQSRWNLRPPAGSQPEVLEVGAGYAGDRDYLTAMLDADYVGVEVVPAVAAASADKGVLHMAVEDAPSEWNGRFQWVYSRHVMEHAIDAEEMLAAVKRVLAPTGIVGQVTPHYFPDPEPAHVSQLTIEQWMALGTKVGLKAMYAMKDPFGCEEAHIVFVHADAVPA